MKRIKTLLMLCLTFLLTCCTSPLPGEKVEVTQQAIGTCPRPTGSCGDTVWPADSYVSAIGADPTASWRLLVRNKLVASPYTVTTCYVDFGGTTTTHSQAKITGSGWSSGGGRKVDEVMYLDSAVAGQSYGCANDSTKVCMLISETTRDFYTPILYFDKAYSVPGLTHVGCGAGLTAIVGMGATDPQKLRHVFDVGGVGPLGTKTITVAGPAFDTCFWP